MSATLDGLDAADVMVLGKADGEASLAAYVASGSSGPLVGAPVFADVVQNGAPWTKTIPLRKGVYYLVWDNTPTAGRVAPPVSLLDDRAATLTYVVQIGDSP